jgi:hypothetical protein
VGKSGFGDGERVWTDADMRRSAIAVWDTGISDAPDLQPQVAAVFGVGNPQIDAHDTFGLAYQDDVRPADFRRADEALNPNNALKIRSVTAKNDPHSRLVAEDDLGSLAGLQHLPTGCDGHGTEVASVAAATAGNRQGIAGVGWNIPLIGLRPYAHYDGQRALKSSPTLRLDDAEHYKVRVTDATLVEQLAIVKALQLPVVNMSWGAQLFFEASSRKIHGVEVRPVVVSSPAVVEAMGRVFADGTTLGVAAAGQMRRYGFAGLRAALREGAPDAVQAPCGLRMLPTLGAQVEVGTTVRPFQVPGVDLQKLNLICVTSSSSTPLAVADGAGSGESAVDLTAPGNDVPVATRPTEGVTARLAPTATYRAANGTSFAAAMVSGAAALLRDLAPGADIGDITRALRAGARSNPSLVGQVRYGQLDVACSALWLSQHRQPKWRLRINVQELQQLHFTDHCFKRSAIAIREWEFPLASFDERAKRFDTANDLIASKLAEDPDPIIAPERKAAARREMLAVQKSLLDASGRKWPSEKFAFFPIGQLPFTRPTAPPERAIYDFGTESMSCPQSYQLMGVAMTWKTTPHPAAYMFATRGHGRTMGRITFNIGLVKPWWWRFLPDEMRVELKLQCENVPPALGGA